MPVRRHWWRRPWRPTCPHSPNHVSIVVVPVHKGWWFRLLVVLLTTVVRTTTSWSSLWVVQPANRHCCSTRHWYHPPLHHQSYFRHHWRQQHQPANQPNHHHHHHHQCNDPYANEEGSVLPPATPPPPPTRRTVLQQPAKSMMRLLPWLQLLSPPLPLRTTIVTATSSSSAFVVANIPTTATAAAAGLDATTAASSSTSSSIADNSSSSNNNNNRADASVRRMMSDDHDEPSLLSSRPLVAQSFSTTTATIKTFGAPAATTTTNLATPRVVDITLTSPAQSLGVEIVNDRRDGTVRIQRIIMAPSSSFSSSSFDQQRQQLQEGMILQDVTSAKALLDRLRVGPYPVTLRFVTDNDSHSDGSGGEHRWFIPPSTSTTTTDNQSLPFASFSIVTTYRPPPVQCGYVSQRGDVMELVYEAYYVVVPSDSSSRLEEVLYDGSDWRGTGQPYQMVLGSGDMIPGVDQGLTNMCAGEKRVLYIPKALGHGPKSRQFWNIPDTYLGLKWSVELVRVENSSPS